MTPKTKKILASCALTLPLLATSILCPILKAEKACADVAVTPFMAYTRPLADFDIDIWCETEDNQALSYPATLHYYDKIGYLPTMIGEGELDFTNLIGYQVVGDRTQFFVEVETWATYDMKSWYVYTEMDGSQVFVDSLVVSHKAPCMLPLNDLSRWAFQTDTDTNYVVGWNFTADVFNQSTNEWEHVTTSASGDNGAPLNVLFPTSTSTVRYRNTDFILCRDFSLTFEFFHGWGVNFVLASTDNFSVSTDVTLAQNEIYNILAPTNTVVIAPTPSEIFFGMVDDFLTTEFMPNFTFGDLCLIALGISAFFMFLKIWMGG